MATRVLITGGCGFVGSALAQRFRQGGCEVVAFDNLHRRGSELNLRRFKESGVTFVHGDIRQSSDLDELPGSFDVMIEASAEPSVLAGVGGSPQYALSTNLVGTLNALELARRRCGAMVFLSTSRVYSIAPLRGLKLLERGQRFELAEEQAVPGVSAKGISEAFPTNLPRSIYGATKLASELVIQEYVDTYGLKAVINRCGVIAGPGQFGKVDQGVFTLWVANHYFRKPLKYTGFGGKGQQVRDLLHPDDLFALLEKQLAGLSRCNGEIYNVGGGPAVSTSLAELTALCQSATGNEVAIASEMASASVDIPYYVSDGQKVSSALQWKPTLTVAKIVGDIADWLRNNEAELKPLFNN